MTPSIPIDKLLACADQYGLPLFVYDAQTISTQIEKLTKAFNLPSFEIRYACKALNTIGIIQHIHAQGCGIDTVSEGEIRIALEAGIPPDKISFTPSGVLLSEYAYAIRHGVHVHVDQLHVLEWIDQHYPGTEITLRFNPGIIAGGHLKLQVGAEDSKFGIHINQVDKIKALTDKLTLKISGIHMHLGSDIGNSNSFDEAYAYVLQVALHWKETLTRIDLGGGFKIPYHPDDHSIDIDSFGKRISQRFIAFCEEVGHELTLIVEPGKYLVSQAGYLLMEVSGTRDIGQTGLAYVSSGFNHFLRPMNYEAYHHIINLSNPKGPESAYDVVGYLCETDTFAHERLIQKISRGDVLCLMNAGAYGFTMSSNYNTRPRPAEVLIKENGEAKLIKRAETIEDLLQTDLGFQNNTTLK